MKRTLLISTLILFIYPNVNAQLKVDSIGKVEIGTPAAESAKLNIDMVGAKNGLYLYYSEGTTSTDTITKGAYIYVSNLNQTDGITGILGQAAGRKVNTQVIGVHGIARNASMGSGIPLGVAGQFSRTNSSTKGAGIYGSNTYNIYNSRVDSLYAGFFDGLTKVRGKLIVTGGIQGTVLTRSSSGEETGRSNGELLSNQMSDRLSGLTTQSYYWDAPADMTAAGTIRQDAESSAFDWKDSNSESGDEVIQIPEYSAIDRQLYAKQHYGLSADQLEEVFPDLVYEDENGNKSINYMEMVPILVQAINELSAKVAALEGGTNAKRAKKAATAISDSKSDITLLSLGQNKPNPFGTATTIDVSVPETVQNAFIYVYDLQGKKVDQVDIAAHGKQSIQLTTANLTAGMYLYSLIADGKVVETRRMIVEK